MKTNDIKSSFFYISSQARVSNNPINFYRTIILAVLLSFASYPAYSCQGDDYQRTLTIVEYSLQIGFEIGMTGDFSQLQTRIEELLQLAQQLPPSCQALLQQMNGAFQNNPSAGTNCMGGVCCDSTGCY